MLACSERHYDGVCKSIGQPGRGSFLYGWKNERETSPDLPQTDVDTRKLDTLMKVLEVGRHLPSEADQRDCFGLSLNLRRVFVRLQECYGRTEEPDIT